MGVVEDLPDDEINEISYKSLRKIQQIEKNQPTLSKIKPGFYNELADFINDFERRLEKEASEQKKTILKDEIENIKKIASNIYEQREKKIVLSAVSRVRGGNPDTSNMTSSEKKLFNNLVGFLLKNREEIFKKTSETQQIPDEEEKTESESEEEKKTTADEETEVKGNINPVVMVNKNIPEFIGTDEKKYYLRKNDVISLPNDMKNMLSKRGVVEELEFLP